MEIISSAAQLGKVVAAYREQGKSIGFVPTMGALHRGHLSLVQQAAEQTDVVVVSIFVNPTQFNNPDDLKRYPRTLEQDAALLSSTSCAAIFAPSVSEIYPEHDTRVFDFGLLAEVMEGKFRPGHFNGVAQVVSRLFDLVKPQKAFFGLKDYQQLAIVRKMTSDLNLGINIVACPIVRESDGLAMSSRNALLTPELRKKSPAIAQTLFETLSFVPEKSVEETRQYVVDTIQRADGLQVEYFELVNGETLQPIARWSDAQEVVGCIAVFAGEIRLIDNVTYKNFQS